MGFIMIDTPLPVHSKGEQFHFRLANLLPIDLNNLSTPAVDEDLDNEQVANICTAFLVRTFHCSQKPCSEPLAALPDSELHLQARRLPSFIAHILDTSGLPNRWAIDAVCLLKHLHRRIPQCAKYELSGYRLFLAAFVLVVKDSVNFSVKSGEEMVVVETVMEDVYWSKVSGFPLEDVEEMQAQLMFQIVERT